MNPEKPVMLVHASGLDHQNWLRPNTEGRLHILAAAQLYLDKQVSKIVFTGGEYKRGEKPMAEVMSNHLKRILRHIPDQDVIAISKAVTTRAEIKVFREEAEKQGWDNLLDISNEDQTRRIKKALTREFGREIAVRNIEDIIVFQTVVKRYRETVGAKGRGKREELLSKLDGLPIVGSLLDWIAHQIPSKCYLEALVTEKLG